MDLYKIQFHVQQVEFSDLPNIRYDRLIVSVTCEDFLKFDLKTNKNLAFFNSKFNSAKAVLFPTKGDNIIRQLETNTRVLIRDSITGIQLGKAYIKWNTNMDEFQKNKFCDVSELYDIVGNDKKKMGVISVHLRIAYYGSNIQIPFSDTGSSLTLNMPLFFINKVQDIKQKLSTWSPLYIAKHKPKRSIMDDTLKMYAELILKDLPREPFEHLTKDYINSHLCGIKNCPVAKRFRDYGFGPLAPEGSGLGTITTIRDVEPCGLYGMSQAYGTLDHYGAFGLLVRRKSQTKAFCGSPDCPYVNYHHQPQEEPEDTRECVCSGCHDSIITQSSSESYNSECFGCGHDFLRFAPCPSSNNAKCCTRKTFKDA